ncbi:hypothetical protein L873DRAFT_1814435 [Choiromyces venosus 120613-1]|uniref:Uncharacterized protein n=1 Tax=Choiromyces venosus 120613-1 TaxID=1336337 RepID=A0A3N4J816_9PEZI|nr:hypothetical protein L873DRAFT_1814435 [Choiromyces venosus 120613-1]
MLLVVRITGTVQPQGKLPHRSGVTAVNRSKSGDVQSPFTPHEIAPSRAIFPPKATFSE